MLKANRVERTSLNSLRNMIRDDKAKESCKATLVSYVENRLYSIVLQRLKAKVGINNALEVDLSLVTKALAENKPLKIHW
ncbi:hypothetical protein [Bartonella schoenbuchensis]|uniref:hypothetical protein n=1 Tax=Bartonella schoenbuchensis TaxID=165694 RepID=UPI001F0AE55C|nr:hypothetical protein [Bartonella schoenbuchensis]